MSSTTKGAPDMGTDSPSGERPTLLMRLALRQQRRRSTQRRGRRVVAVGAVSVVTSLATGLGAYAYFTTHGSGTGAASAGSSQGLTLSPATVNSNKLYPGGTGDVVMTITNPNPFKVAVTQLTLPATAGTAYTDSGLTTLNATCNTNGTGGVTPVSWAYTTKALTGVVVAAAAGGTSGSLTLTLTGAAAMSSTSDTSCQNSFFKMANVSAVTATQSTASAVPTATN